jgi:glycosyltransferase involved in cell wall biosynthesis
MKSTPLVSVIVPSYNSTQWIEECLTSVHDQSYLNIELIVVDDGSADNSVKIIKKLKFEFKLIEQANQGRSGARNTGIEAAKGDYIAFLDCDDLLAQTSIEERVKFLNEKKDLGWVFTDAVEFDQTGDLRLFLDQFPWLYLEQDQFIQLLKKCYPLTSTVMIRREVLQKSGNFDPKLTYAEDLELFMRIALFSKVGMIRKPLTRRRIHSGQAVSSTFDRWDSRVGIFEDFVNSHNDLSSEYKDALDSAHKHACFKLGEWYWEVFDLKQARDYFIKSLGNNKWSQAANKYKILSRLPVWCIRFLRKLKGH